MVNVIILAPSFFPAHSRRRFCNSSSASVQPQQRKDMKNASRIPTLPSFMADCTRLLNCILTSKIYSPAPSPSWA